MLKTTKYVKESVITGNCCVQCLNESMMKSNVRLGYEETKAVMVCPNCRSLGCPKKYNHQNQCQGLK